MAQLTEEDLKKMSPEQIQELQKQNCIFCHIISGKVPAKKVYEDDVCLAILDINPASKGHLLILPKEHYALMPLVPQEIQEHIFKVCKQLSHSALKAFKCSGTNIFLANGQVAGQKAPHTMIHLIPRYDGDGLKTFDLPKNPVKESDLDQLSAVLRKGVEKTFGIKLEEKPPEKQVEKEEVDNAKEPEKPVEEKDIEEDKKEQDIAKEDTEEKEEVDETEEPEKEDVSLDDIADMFK